MTTRLHPLATLAAVLVTTAAAGAGMPSVAEPVVPPCPQEDSPGSCYGDASLRGNGIGASFTVTADGEVIY